MHTYVRQILPRVGRKIKRPSLAACYCHPSSHRLPLPGLYPPVLFTSQRHHCLYNASTQTPALQQIRRQTFQRSHLC